MRTDSRKTLALVLAGTVALAVAGTARAEGCDATDSGWQRFVIADAALGAGGEARVLRTFGIGGRTFHAVAVPAGAAEGFARAAARGGFVEADACRRAVRTGDDPHFAGAGLWGQDFDNQWAIRRAGFEPANGDTWPDPATLAPVTVAVIDSGIDWYHPDLPGGALWRNDREVPGNGTDDDGNGYADDLIGWNFIDNHAKPWDEDGHGTFVAGVIAAGRGNGTGIAGINPAARIMVLKALDAFGRGHASMVAEAIAYAADNGARVVNLSLGGRTLTRIEQAAVDHAVARGAVVVVAAGNDGEEVAGYSPAGLEGVITVTATDRADRRAGFSNWGPAIDIAAPGVDVLSLRARRTDLLSLIPGVKYEAGAGIVGEDRAYFRASGTSFAAPIVSGTLSLIMARDPTVTAAQARRMVLHSARDIETPGVDNYTGYGLIDAAAAVTASPDYYLESRISGVLVTKQGGKTILRVLGTADADRFGKATILLGQGAEPAKWLRVNVAIGEPVADGTLMDLPAALFKGARTWTIRLVTEHATGAKREARFKLTLG